MSERSRAALTFHKTHGVADFRPFNLHVAGLAGLEVLIEGLGVILHIAGIQKPLCKVRTGKRSRMNGKRHCAFKGPLAAAGRKEFSHPFPALNAFFVNAFEESLEGFRIRIEVIGRHMNRFLSPARGNFNAGHECDAKAFGFCTSLLNAVHRVVIGEAHQLYAVAGAKTNNFCRRKNSVRRVGMHMQINSHDKALRRLDTFCLN